MTVQPAAVMFTTATQFSSRRIIYRGEKEDEEEGVQPPPFTRSVGDLSPQTYSIALDKEGDRVAVQNEQVAGGLQLVAAGLEVAAIDAVGRGQRGLEGGGQGARFADGESAQVWVGAGQRQRVRVRISLLLAVAEFSAATVVFVVSAAVHHVAVGLGCRAGLCQVEAFASAA